MQAVILLGGAGTRLRPLTLEIPKPMVEVNGKPFLLYIISELKKYGIRDFVFCAGYLADKIKDFFGDGSSFEIKIDYSIEGDFLGTAGALKLAEKYLQDDFFVLNGDTYLPIDYEKIYRDFKQANKMGMIVLYDNREPVAEANTALDEENWVIAYGKKEPLKKGDQLIEIRQKKEVNYAYVDAGAYVFKKEVLSLIEKNKFVSLEGDIYPELIKNRELKGFVTAQRYYDLGTPERLELIRKVLK